MQGSYGLLVESNHRRLTETQTSGILQMALCCAKVAADGDRLGGSDRQTVDPAS